MKMKVEYAPKMAKKGKSDTKHTLIKRAMMKRMGKC